MRRLLRRNNATVQSFFPTNKELAAFAPSYLSVESEETPMGDDGHGRSRKRRPSPSPSSTSGGASAASSAEEEERRRRSGKRRSHKAGDGERASRGDEKKSRRKEEKGETARKEGEKSRKRSREDRDEKKRRMQKKSREKEKHRSTGGKVSDSFEELSKEDYYLKNNEFSTWLKEEKGMFFSDLSSETARELFSKFVKEWNRGKLQPRYYEGIASGPRTGHDWKMKA